MSCCSTNNGIWVECSRDVDVSCLCGKYMIDLLNKAQQAARNCPSDIIRTLFEKFGPRIKRVGG